MSVHYYGEHIYTAFWDGLTSTVSDAMSLGNDFALTRWYNVSPVWIDANTEDTGIVCSQTFRVVQSQTRTIGHEAIKLRIRVVGLEHVETRSAMRVQSVSGFRRIIEALNKIVMEIDNFLV